MHSQHWCIVVWLLIYDSILLKDDKFHIWLSPMGAYGHANAKPSLVFGTLPLACTRGDIVLIQLASFIVPACSQWPRHMAQAIHGEFLPQVDSSGQASDSKEQVD